MIQRSHSSCGRSETYQNARDSGCIEMALCCAVQNGGVTVALKGHLARRGTKIRYASCLGRQGLSLMSLRKLTHRNGPASSDSELSVYADVAPRCARRRTR